MKIILAWPRNLRRCGATQPRNRTIKRTHRLQEVRHYTAHDLLREKRAYHRSRPLIIRTPSRYPPRYPRWWIARGESWPRTYTRAILIELTELSPGSLRVVRRPAPSNYYGASRTFRPRFSRSNAVFLRRARSSVPACETRTVISSAFGASDATPAASVYRVL